MSVVWKVYSAGNCWKIGEMRMIIQIALLLVLIALAISIVADIREGR